MAGHLEGAGTPESAEITPLESLWLDTRLLLDFASHRGLPVRESAARAVARYPTLEAYVSDGEAATKAFSRAYEDLRAAVDPANPLTIRYARGKAGMADRMSIANVPIVRQLMIVRSSSWCPSWR